jgi:hypothetical protein
MQGPLDAPSILVLFPFRFRDPVSGKWVRARYVAERYEIAARYAEWEITCTPELQRPQGAAFSPWKWLTSNGRLRLRSSHVLLHTSR